MYRTPSTRAIEIKNTLELRAPSALAGHDVGERSDKEQSRYPTDEAHCGRTTGDECQTPAFAPEDVANAQRSQRQPQREAHHCHERPQRVGRTRSRVPQKLQLTVDLGSQLGARPGRRFSAADLGDSLLCRRQSVSVGHRDASRDQNSGAKALQRPKRSGTFGLGVRLGQSDREQRVRRGRLDDARALTRELGVLTDFRVIGPFANSNGEGHELSYPPEWRVAPGREEPGLLGPVRWRPLEAGLDGVLNLDQVFFPFREVTAYALASVYLSEPATAALRFGADDQVKIWLDGLLVYAANISHPARFDQHSLGLRLKAGPRELDGRKALAFSRSRHTDSDYDRSKRQHQVLTAAATKVRKRGADQLAALVDVARKKIVTDMPLRGAPAMLELALKADLDKVKSVVLEPGRYARQLPGGYTIAPRVVEVQKLFDKLFKPVE